MLMQHPFPRYNPVYPGFRMKGGDSEDSSWRSEDGNTLTSIHTVVGGRESTGSHLHSEDQSMSAHNEASCQIHKKLAQYPSLQRAIEKLESVTIARVPVSKSLSVPLGEPVGESKHI